MSPLSVTDEALGKMTSAYVAASPIRDPIEWKRKSTVVGMTLDGQWLCTDWNGSVIVQLCPACDGYRCTTFRGVITNEPTTRLFSPAARRDVYRCERGHDFIIATDLPSPPRPTPPD